MGVRCQQTPNPETRNLNTNLVTAEGLLWVFVIYDLQFFTEI